MANGKKVRCVLHSPLLAEDTRFPRRAKELLRRDESLDKEDEGASGFRMARFFLITGDSWVATGTSNSKGVSLGFELFRVGSAEGAGAAAYKKNRVTTSVRLKSFTGSTIPSSISQMTAIK